MQIDDRLDAITGAVPLEGAGPLAGSARRRTVFAAAAAALAAIGDTSQVPTTSQLPTTTVVPDAEVAAPKPPAPEPATDCRATFPGDTSGVGPPPVTGGEELRFEAEVIFPQGPDYPFLQTRVLEAPEGTSVIHIVVNGRGQGGGSWLPGVVNGLPLRDITTAEVELCAYDTDDQLITSAVYDEVLVVD